MTKHLIGGILLLLGLTCSSFASEGESLFKANCSACHSVGKGKVVGPDLLGATKRHNDAWLQKWIASSTTLINSGDPVAVKLFKDNNEFPMPDAPISADDIKKVIEYLHSTQDGVKPTVALHTGMGEHGHIVANPVTHFTLQQTHGSMVEKFGFTGFILLFISLLATMIVFAFCMLARTIAGASRFQ